VISLSVSNVSSCYFLSRKKLERMAAFILKEAGIRDAVLSINFVRDRAIKDLNYLYRGKNRPTDVLSFSMREGRRIKKDNLILGDVVISTERARRQAADFGSTFKKEVILYIVHGILHLIGYDDEDASSEKRMRRKEKQIFDRLWEKYGTD